MLAILSVHFKVALHYAPSFLAFLKFRGLWRLLECSSALRSGDSISNRKFFSDMKEGGRVGESYLSLPSLSLAIPPLDSAQKHLIVTAATATTARLRHSIQSEQLDCFTFSDSNFQGGVNQFPPFSTLRTRNHPRHWFASSKFVLIFQWSFWKTDYKNSGQVFIVIYFVKRKKRSWQRSALAK